VRWSVGQLKAIEDGLRVLKAKRHSALFCGFEPSHYIAQSKPPHAARHRLW
jgi:hypothetical protein